MQTTYLSSDLITATHHWIKTAVLLSCKYIDFHIINLTHRNQMLFFLHYLLGKGGYVFDSVGLSVCLFVCEQHYSKSYERIGMKFYVRVLSSTSKNWLNFGGDLGIVRWVNEQKNTVIVHTQIVVKVMIQNLFFFFFFFFLGGWVVFHNQGSTFLQWTIWE